ncbi:putative cell division protein [Plasmodium yoelii yoelii]|uniref:Cell division protein n=1 Tax=Plasmodium yoelii yoelii TaxID=73239 RepID=Q7RDN4_PLAYO|nr:putative cell division protein [Plasmodium yoelii yoelii]
MNDIDEFIQSQLILSSLKVCCSVLKIGGNFISKIFRGEYTGLLIFYLNKFFEKIYVCKPQSSRNKSLESFLVCLNFHLPKSSITSLFINRNEVCYNSQNENELRNIHLELINGKDQDLQNNINDKTCFDDKIDNNLVNSSDSEKENNLNNMKKKKKNLDIFNFYCSDSDEDIKYFNSDEEENFNNYISSNFLSNNKLFSFIATQNYYDSDKSYLLPQNYIRHEPQIMPLQPPYLLSLQNRRKENKKASRILSTTILTYLDIRDDAIDYNTLLLFPNFYFLLILLKTIPTYFFLSSFTIIILFWSQVYYSSMLVTSQHLKSYYIYINFSGYIINLLFAIIEYLLSSFKNYIYFNFIFESLVDYSIAISFLYYGVKILSLAIVMFVILSLKGLYSFWCFTNDGELYKAQYDVPTYDALIYFISECIPSIFIIYTFQSNKDKNVRT